MSTSALVECDCLSHRCRDAPSGYKKVSPSTRTQHRNSDNVINLEALQLTDRKSYKLSKLGAARARIEASQVIDSAESPGQLHFSRHHFLSHTFLRDKNFISR